MNKGLIAFIICLLLSSVDVSAQVQRLVPLQPARAIELALQNNEAVKQGGKSRRTRQGKPPRI